VATGARSFLSRFVPGQVSAAVAATAGGIDALLRSAFFAVLLLLLLLLLSSGGPTGMSVLLLFRFLILFCFCVFTPASATFQHLIYRYAFACQLCRCWRLLFVELLEIYITIALLEDSKKRCSRFESPATLLRRTIFQQLVMGSIIRFLCPMRVFLSEKLHPLSSPQLLEDQFSSATRYGSTINIANAGGLQGTNHDFSVYKLTPKQVVSLAPPLKSYWFFCWRCFSHPPSQVYFFLLLICTHCAQCCKAS
jgi:hypothetical protein